jgi:rubrerythrin
MEHHDKYSQKKGTLDTEKEALYELITLLNTQLRMEEELIRLYEETKGRTESIGVSHLLHMMALDSMKHKDICQIVIGILRGDSILTPEKQEIKEGLNRHIELENGSVERTNKILKNQWVKETEGVRELIKELRDGKKNHHKILQTLLKKPFFRQNPRYSLGWMQFFRDLEWYENRKTEARKFLKKKKRS